MFWFVVFWLGENRVSTVDEGKFSVSEKLIQKEEQYNVKFGSRSYPARVLGRFENKENADMYRDSDEVNSFLNHASTSTSRKSTIRPVSDDDEWKPKKKAKVTDKANRAHIKVVTLHESDDEIDQTIPWNNANSKQMKKKALKEKKDKASALSSGYKTDQQNLFKELNEETDCCKGHQEILNRMAALERKVDESIERTKKIQEKLSQARPSSSTMSPAIPALVIRSPAVPSSMVLEDITSAESPKTATRKSPRKSQESPQQKKTVTTPRKSPGKSQTGYLTPPPQTPSALAGRHEENKNIVVANASISESELAGAKMKKNPFKVALRLMDLLFTQEEMASSNLTGQTKGGNQPKKILNVDKIRFIKEACLDAFPLEKGKWDMLKLNAKVNQKCIDARTSLKRANQLK